MAEINEKGHVSVIIGSIEKSYKKARLTGKLTSNDAYILEAIYKLLGACYTSLSQPNRRTLTTLYNRILTTSKNTCMPMILAQDIKVVKPEFIQAEFLDCNTYESNQSVYYWQEIGSSIVNADVLAKIAVPGFLNAKPSDTLPVFSAGKTITLIPSNIGRVCFAVTDTKSTSTFSILDSSNTNITSTFTKTFINIHTTLFVSISPYAYASILFKVNKLT